MVKYKYLIFLLIYKKLCLKMSQLSNGIFSVFISNLLYIILKFYLSREWDPCCQRRAVFPRSFCTALWCMRYIWVLIVHWHNDPDWDRAAAIIHSIAENLLREYTAHRGRQPAKNKPIITQCPSLAAGIIYLLLYEIHPKFKHTPVNGNYS